MEGVGEQLRQAKKASRQHLERREEVGAKEAKAEAGALVVEVSSVRCNVAEMVVKVVNALLSVFGSPKTCFGTPKQVRS